MKYSFFSTLLLAAALCPVSCTLDKEYRPGDVTPVSSLISPEDGRYEKFRSGSDATLTFSWFPAYAEDGMGVQYEVVFYDSPDRNNEYRIDAGFNTSVEIPHKQLDKAAKSLGIGNGADGVMYWSVISSRGVNEAEATVSPRRIEVTRLNSFEVLPAEVYITGEGTECGTDLSSAFKAISEDEEGVFTFYHRLEAGKGVTFTSGKTGDYTTYTIVDGILDDHSTEPATVSESAVYKITLDFNTRGVTFEEVSKVIFNFAPRTEDNRDMAYAGNGCWKMTDYPVVFKQESWGLDERYNFRATIDGTEYVWGYVSNDSGTQSGEQPASYFYIYNYLYASITAEYPYFNYSFKFNTGLNGLTVDITVCMNGDTEHPTHIIDNIR